MKKKSGNITDILVPIHREGYLYIFLFFALAFLTAVFLTTWLLALTLPLLLWCIYFFRDPHRITPTISDGIISPADGYIQYVGPSHLPKELNNLVGKKKYIRISVFMNVFNVHVNRMPVAGKILFNHYHAGKFLNASFDKASELNERQSLWIKTKHNTEIGLVQIAGLIARRILCDAPIGRQFQTGQRYGMIRFGSRVDVYLPLQYEILVLAGQTAIGGETILAKIIKKK